MSATVDKFINFEQSMIHYQITGSENSGDWVVLLHGKKFRSADWVNSGLVDKLSNQGFKVIALNLPGYGHSEPLKSDVSYPDFVAAFLQQLEISKFHLIGPSFSGEISLQYALQHQATLQSLTIIASINVDKYVEKLETIQTNTLIVWGKKDEVAPYKDSFILQEKIPHSKLFTYDDLGHTCYFDDMATFEQVLLEHLLK